MLAANRRWAEGFALGDLTAAAAAGVAVVTCMDVRIDPLPALGLRPGDADVIRNAGGRVTDDVLRSLTLAAAFLGVTEVVVMHHTGCAIAGRSDDDVRRSLPPDVAAHAEGWEVLAMPDPDAALAADVAAVRDCELLPPGLRVEGWRYDVATGLAHPVVSSR